MYGLPIKINQIMQNEYKYMFFIILMLILYHSYRNNITLWCNYDVSMAPCFSFKIIMTMYVPCMVCWINQISLVVLNLFY